MEDIEDLLLQIEEELDNGKKSFFGSGVTVDAEVIVNILNKIRDVYPLTPQRAVSAKKTAPPPPLRPMVPEFNQAEETQKASNIVLMAQQRADQILSEHNIVHQAQREADIIRQQAAEHKTKVLNEVRAEVNELLGDAQRKLNDALNAINGALTNNNAPYVSTKI
ncbi:MAG: hypothetical protein LBF68_05000 [Christensenellaceae bacterium]|jgi:vacuolar-type H+-ATPase subunit H|nr:hypothetical protein [Christensenellaceae bacterium]